MPKPAANKLKNDSGGLHVSWMTVSYRSVALFVICVLGAFYGAVYLIFPSVTNRVADKTKTVFVNWLDRMVGNGTHPPVVATSNQAHFTNLDGTVEIRRKGKNDWEQAGYNVPLEKGDTIRTGSEGMAKVSFPDGTNYVVKPESFIVVEENSTDENGKMNVVVDVPTGTVDLHTGTFTQGSRSQVVVGDARVGLESQTAAIVDASNDQHDVVVKSGGAEVVRSNGETVALAKNEKVSFQGENSQTVKEKEIVPPTLIAPANQLPFSIGPDGNTTFSWAPADDAKFYHLVISKNAFMSPVLVDKPVVSTTSTRIAGLTEGTYFWSVRSVNAAGKESPESDRNKFTIIPQAKVATLALALEEPIKTSHTVEIVGKTEPDARVVVNGEEVPLVDSDGSFHYFLSGLPNGPNTITITAQNSQGVNTQYKTVEIP